LESTLRSKADSYMSEISKLKIEIAKNVDTQKDLKEKLEGALMNSANLKKKLTKFSSHNKPKTSASGLNEINESLVEDLSDEFERDEDASGINTSQTLGLVRKSRDVIESTKLSEQRIEDLLICREATDEQEEFDDDDTPLSITDVGNETKQEDSLLYSLDTNTQGGNSSFGASGKLGFFQNNLQNMIRSAERNG